MAQRHEILISIAPVSPSTSADGQCAGISKNGSRCKRLVKGKAYCHSHDLQLPKPEPTSPVLAAEPTSAAQAPSTRNEITANLLPNSYYQCAGISQNGSRCKRYIKGRAYCHSHNMQLPKPEPTSAAEVAPRTMNSTTSQVPYILSPGYYQCTGISKTGSRCKRHVKGKGYCHSHALQPLKPEPTSHIPDASPRSTAESEAAPLTMNSITSRIPNLLPPGYYQCAGISKNGHRCKWHVKDNAYCFFHDMQLLEAISHSQADKDVVTRMITQVRSRRQKGEPMHEDPLLADIRDSLRHWTPIHVSNFLNLLLNITKGPLEPSDRNQGPHAVVPTFNHSYLCRGRTKLGRSCRMRTVGGFHCRHHDPSGISGCDVAMAFASI